MVPDAVLARPGCGHREMSSPQLPWHIALVLAFLQHPGTSGRSEAHECRWISDLRPFG